MGSSSDPSASVPRTHPGGAAAPVILVKAVPHPGRGEASTRTQINASRTPRFGGFLISVSCFLLPRRHGFEGFGPACERLPTDDLAIPQGPDGPGLPARLRAALLSAAVVRRRCQHLITRVLELIDFHARIVEGLPEKAQEPAEALGPPIDLLDAREKPSRDELKIGRRECRNGAQRFGGAGSFERLACLARRRGSAN